MSVAETKQAPPPPAASLEFSKLEPIDSVSIDFAKSGGRYCLVVAERSSGYTMVAQTPDPLMEIAVKFLKKLGCLGGAQRWWTCILGKIQGRIGVARNHTSYKHAKCCCQQWAC